MAANKYELGTIIKGRMNHMAAILGYFEDEPIAVMITSKGPDKYPCNLLMSKLHFESGHKFGWRDNKKPSFMVRHKFLKTRDWEPFVSVGRLTPEGIVFIKKHVSKKDSIYWRDYDNKQCVQHTINS